MKKSLWFNHQALLTLLILNMSVSYIVRFMVYDRLHELDFRVLAVVELILRCLSGDPPLR